MAPTRFPSGVTNVAQTDTLGMFGAPDPTLYHVYFDDFHTFTAAQWVITTTEAGASSASEAVANEDGGVLLVTNDTADNDNDFFQKVGESFRFVAGKKLWFKARIKTNDAVQSDIFCGLLITDTTPLDVTDGVFFLKADDAASVSFLVEKNNTATTTANVATMVNNTWVDLGFYYNGVDAIDVFVNGEKVARSAVTNLPDDEELTISFGIQNGAAASKTLSVDYLFCAKQR